MLPYYMLRLIKDYLKRFVYMENASSLPTYDYIIVGAGAAGLSLAYQLVHSPLSEKKILIIDREAKNKNDRTWCFWENHPGLYDHIIFRTWSNLAFHSDQFHKVFHLFPYQYKMIRGIDFYNEVFKVLNHRPNITKVIEDVLSIEDHPDYAEVHTTNQSFKGGYVFDSRNVQQRIPVLSNQHHYLMQHFLGWEIKTKLPTFTPNTATLFDFRTDQYNSMRFFYILPYSQNQALVEYTLFSSELLTQTEYEHAIQNYISEIINIREADYTIEGVEKGIIPMTDFPFSRRLGSRVMAIGTKGGLVKPSTGYAFLRIQKDTAAIINSLILFGHPFNVPNPEWRYRMYDSTMLQQMYRRGGKMKSYFTSMFQLNPIHRVFRFLDETASFPDNLALMATLPVLDFFLASIKTQILRKI